MTNLAAGLSKQGLVLFLASTAGYAVFSTIVQTPPLFDFLNILTAVSALAWLFLFNGGAASLQQVFFTCSLIFYSIVPRIEYSYNWTYWLGSTSVFNYYIQTTALALGGVWAYGIAFRISNRKSIRNGTYSRQKQLVRCNAPLLLILSLATVVLIYHLNGYSAIEVFIRETVDTSNSIHLGQSTSLIYSTAIRPIPTICFVVYMMYGEKRFIYSLILFMLMIVGNPVTGMARWQGSMLLLAVILSIAPSLFRASHFLTFSTFLGLFLVAPILDLFRRIENYGRLSLGLDWMKQGHLDTFQMAARAIEVDLVTMGDQLIGVFLFFVPREIWPSKPISSGSVIAERANLAWENVSMNLLGEGFINFGILGAISLLAVHGVLCARIERTFQNDDDFNVRSKIFYLFYIGGSIFIFRGSLLSAFAYMIGTYFAIYLVTSMTVKSQTVNSVQKN